MVTSDNGKKPDLHDKRTKQYQEKNIKQTNYTNHLAEITETLEGAYQERNKCRQNRLPNSKCNICEDIKEKIKKIITGKVIKCECTKECECPLKKEKDQCRRSVIRARHNIDAEKRKKKTQERGQEETSSTNSKEDWRLRVKKDGRDQEIKLNEVPTVKAVKQIEKEKIEDVKDKIEDKIEDVKDKNEEEPEPEEPEEPETDNKEVEGSLEVQPEEEVHKKLKLTKFVEKLIKK